MLQHFLPDRISYSICYLYVLAMESVVSYAALLHPFPLDTDVFFCSRRVKKTFIICVCIITILAIGRLCARRCQWSQARERIKLGVVIWHTWAYVNHRNSNVLVFSLHTVSNAMQCNTSAYAHQWRAKKKKTWNTLYTFSSPIARFINVCVFRWLLFSPSPPRTSYALALATFNIELLHHPDTRADLRPSRKNKNVCTIAASNPASGRPSACDCVCFSRWTRTNITKKKTRTTPTMKKYRLPWNIFWPIQMVANVATFIERKTPENKQPNQNVLVRFSIPWSHAMAVSCMMYTSIYMCERVEKQSICRLPIWLIICVKMSTEREETKVVVKNVYFFHCYYWDEPTAYSNSNNGAISGKERAVIKHAGKLLSYVRL